MDGGTGLGDLLHPYPCQYQPQCLMAAAMQADNPPMDSNLKVKGMTALSKEKDMDSNLKVKGTAPSKEKDMQKQVDVKVIGLYKSDVFCSL